MDEFVFGGKEDLKQGRNNDTKKKKIVVAVEIGKDRGVKRAYSKRIDNYYFKELSKIFLSHISNTAKVTTDKWTGYSPLKKEYNITQIKSNASDFFEVNTIIHQLKVAHFHRYIRYGRANFQLLKKMVLLTAV